jgi:hypothetical protein
LQVKQRSHGILGFDGKNDEAFVCLGEYKGLLGALHLYLLSREEERMQLRGALFDHLVWDLLDRDLFWSELLTAANMRDVA